MQHQPFCFYTTKSLTPIWSIPTWDSFKSAADDEENEMDVYLFDSVSVSSSTSYEAESLSSDSFPPEEEMGMEVEVETEAEMETAHVQLHFLAKLSKTPVLDAFAYCVVNRYGIELVHELSTSIKFHIFDATLFFETSAQVCGKINPTTSINNRLKSLRRYFPNIRKDISLIQNQEIYTPNTLITSKVQMSLARMRKFIKKHAQ